MREGDLLFETLRLQPRIDAAMLATAWRVASARGLMALADFELSHGWLLRRLRETGADRDAPRAFVEALTRRVRDDAARALLVDAEALNAVARLDALGLPCVLLKGAARRAAAGRWPCADARFTTDVDLLVPAAEAQRAFEGLQAAGYRTFRNTNPSYHLPALMGPGGVAVELHTSLNHTLPADEAWRRMAGGALDITWQGHLVRVPSTTESLWHGLVHAEPHKLEAWRLRLLLDGAAPLAGSDPIDWSAIATRLNAGEVPDVLAARRWLGAAAQLAGITVPDVILGNTAAFDAPRALRWRLAVLARRKNAGMGARLLEEGTRVELGWPPAESVPGSGTLKQLRRQLGGQAARSIYRSWRARDARGTAAVTPSPP